MEDNLILCSLEKKTLSKETVSKHSSLRDTCDKDLTQPL